MVCSHSKTVTKREDANTEKVEWEYLGRLLHGFKQRKLVNNAAFPRPETIPEQTRDENEKANRKQQGSK